MAGEAEHGSSIRRSRWCMMAAWSLTSPGHRSNDWNRASIIAVDGFDGTGEVVTTTVSRGCSVPGPCPCSWPASIRGWWSGGGWNKESTKWWVEADGECESKIWNRTVLFKTHTPRQTRYNTSKYVFASPQCHKISIDLLQHTHTHTPWYQGKRTPTHHTRPSTPTHPHTHAHKHSHTTLTHHLK